MASKQNQKKPNKLRKNSFFIWAILLLGLLVRLYKINTPLADWHSWRQVDTASVAVEYTKNGVNLLKPRYLDLSNIPSGKENPEGFRMVEFPLVSGVIAWIYQFIPKSIPLHVFYRIDSILFSIGSIFLIYKITQMFEDEKTSLLSALVFSILPFNIYYSRTVLPEVGLVFFSLLTLYSLSKFFITSNHNLKTPWYWTALFSGAIALLIKPVAMFFALPAVYLGLKKCGLNLLKDKKSYLFIFLVFLPLVLWRYWISQFPEGVPAYLWLLNGNDIRFKGAFFRWIFADRMGRLILGYWGLLFFGLGFLKKAKSSFFGWWLFATMMYLFTFATGNVQHDYYQIIIIPIISVYVAKGISFLLNQKTIKSKILLITSFGFMMAFSWYEVRGYYNINNPAIVEAGKFVDQSVESGALVIAPYQGDTAFLYQTNRRGWPIGGNIEQRIEQGARYYITTTLDDEAKELMEICEVTETNDQFTLIKLECEQEEVKIEESEDNASVEGSPIPTPTPEPTPTPKATQKPSWPPGKNKPKK
ncbi:ArnT family glycosyltransferase [Patescibacteria group bacterium]